MDKQVPEFTVAIAFYPTMAVISVPHNTDSELYQAREKLVALGIQCSVMDIGGGEKVLSVPIKTVRGYGNDFLENVQSCLRGSPKLMPRLA
ncbi:MAG: hypothetical protein Q8Q46_03240 [Candidatus Giovannonibacteria bacterium]|nr:hypothetical protein [Candidatus Giovannonibacteria bacterium]